MTGLHQRSLRCDMEQKKKYYMVEDLEDGASKERGTRYEKLVVGNWF